MANHVYNYITVEGNEAVQKEWDELFTNYHEDIERPSYHGDGTITVREYKQIELHPFLEAYDEDNWYSWGCEHIGAKWAHIEDADEYHAYIVSAWSPVVPYLESLYYHLSMIDEEVVIKCNYEDEFRNFIGVWLNGDYEEVDGDELMETFQSKYDVDTSSEDFDWWDESEGHGVADELFDNIVHEWFENAF